ncbi:uncharacterized protein BO88DRAFT_344917, partial [Aspergillus vadensis CBS 113365]
NALRIKQILEIQKYLHINQEYYIPVLSFHIRLLLCDIELFPKLIIFLNMSLRVLGHENVITAAQKKLYGKN